MATNNAAAIAALDGFIKRVNSLKGFAKEAAPLVVVAVKREIAQNIDAAVGPDGKAWELTESGKKPLRNAAAAVEVQALGTVVLITLRGVEVRHHKGTAKGGVRRPIIPTSKMPETMTTAVRKVVERKFNELMGGA